MRIGVVGCGYVFDIYMRTMRAHPEIEIVALYDIDSSRLDQVAAYYCLPKCSNYEAMLTNPLIDTVLNLTSIDSHYQVTRLALQAGKHVYSEKPLTTNLRESLELFEQAEVSGVQLCCAPCNLFSDSISTLIRAVNSGSIGRPLLVYAELDDNPIQHMDFESVKSPSGADWPLLDEIMSGCTFEHVGYHLVWLCALLGPVESVTAFSAELVENKSAVAPGFVGTPDFSVACLNFANGAAARVTCSVVAPRDHRIRVIGREGEISSDGYRQYRAPVFLELFSKRTLSARKLYSLRRYPFLGRLVGIGGSRIKLNRTSKSHAVEGDFRQKRTLRDWLVELIRRKEVYSQDKFLGVALMADKLRAGGPPLLGADFILHINELTLLIQNAGRSGATATPATCFNHSALLTSLDHQ